MFPHQQYKRIQLPPPVYRAVQFTGTNIKEIKKLIEGEKIYYTDLIKKINHYGISQDRTIMLTNKALYNMKKKTLKRKR